jgi:predicted TIM-barrel fold metal-dependent hydrolase
MSGILEQWLEGNGLPGTMVIDGHIHIGSWPHAATFNNADEAATESIRYMDANGIDAICALGGGYLWGLNDYHLGNDFLLDVWKKIPDRMVPFLNVNPNDTRENILNELKRMQTAGVRCIKLINSYQEDYPGDGPNLMALYEFASKNKMLVINHYWSEKAITDIAARFPETDFIFAHYSGGYQDRVLKTFSNVYANIWIYGEMGWLDRGIKHVGAGKFILGSEGFLNSLSVGIGPVVFADISDDEKRRILGLTMARLLDKVEALPEIIRTQYKI